MAYFVCVPKYLHQEAESKQNMLNKIQLNQLQKHYSNTASSKCKYNKILSSVTDFSVLFALQNHHRFVCCHRENRFFSPQPQQHIKNGWKSYPGGSDHTIRRISNFHVFWKSSYENTYRSNFAGHGDNQSRPDFNPRLRIFVFSYRCVTSLLTQLKAYQKLIQNKILFDKHFSNDVKSMLLK